MKTGYYRLIVSCDVAGCQQQDIEHTGADEPHAEQRAREAGWSIGDSDACPAHREAQS